LLVGHWHSRRDDRQRRQSFFLWPNIGWMDWRGDMASVGFGGNFLSFNTGNPFNAEFYCIRAFRPLTP